MRDDGFSLIETTIAAALLGAGLLALLQLLLVASRANRAAADVTMAAILAAEKVEELRSLRWGAAASGADANGAYRRRWTVGAWLGDSPAAIAITVDVEPGGAHLATVRARDAP